MATPASWQHPFAVLRAKWHEVPVGLERRSTADLVHLSDTALLDLWLQCRHQATTGPLYAARGWYHDLYTSGFRGQRLADVGSGMGYEGVTFAQAGATVTFVDVVESNIEVVRRVCTLMGVGSRTDFLYLETPGSLASLRGEYDVILCNGSLHHVPFDVARVEAQELLNHLPPGGRWVQLAYPKARWERQGSPPFSDWGRKTDGEATPWAEWYDLAKVLALLEPAEFEVVLAFDYHSSDFNWFDLKRVAPGAGDRGVASARSSVRVEAEVARQQERIAALEAEVERHRSRLVAVGQSRWRALGQRLGVSPRPEWEDEYRS